MSLPVVARLPSCFALGALASFIVLACSSEPSDAGGGSGGSGGATGPSTGGTSSGSGGQPSAGGTGTGGTEATGGASSGGSEGNGDGGLGGEMASDGSEASGGAEGVGGTQAVGYDPCDDDLGSENNPDCDGDTICVGNTCVETCPTDFQNALTYDCPATSSGDAPSQCSAGLGRCVLLCMGQNGETFTCPDGMVCEAASCVWPE
jgi:hypothetical protein